MPRDAARPPDAVHKWKCVPFAAPIEPVRPPIITAEHKRFGPHIRNRRSKIVGDHR